MNLLPNMRVVGGTVRDLILGIEISDIDFAISTDINIVRDILIGNDYKVIDTGLQHGTITCIPPKCGSVFDLAIESYEITMLRKDDITDGRHAVVSFYKGLSVSVVRLS